jgi:hypothetical protein
MPVASDHPGPLAGRQIRRARPPQNCRRSSRSQAPTADRPVASGAEAAATSERAEVARWRHAWARSSRSSHQRSSNSMRGRLQIDCDSCRARTHRHSQTRARRSCAFCKRVESAAGEFLQLDNSLSSCAPFRACVGLNRIRSVPDKQGHHEAYRRHESQGGFR